MAVRPSHLRQRDREASARTLAMPATMVRLPRALRDAVDAYAAANRLTVSGAVEALLQRGLGLPSDE